MPAIGFSPLHRTPVLLHHHNEFIHESIFLKGIDIFVDMIANLADLPWIKILNKFIEAYNILVDVLSNSMRKNKV